MIKKLSLIGITLCLSLSFLVGQSVSGSVSDQNGASLPGVNILIKGTSTGTITDIDGKFAIDLGTGQEVLVFSFTGFETVEVGVDGRSELTINMLVAASQLNEVVITGYGTQIRKNLSSSISKIDAGKLNRVPASSFEGALQGRAAGVQVVNSSAVSGSAIKIRIRGTSSASANSEPLYVIDGVVMESGAISASNPGAELRDFSLQLAHNTNALSSINPNDIESLEVLKDAAATAIYGARGANGVVLITTKKGKSGKTKIDLDVQTGISEPTHKVEYLNGKEYLFLAQEAWYNGGNDPLDFWKASGVLIDGLTKEQALRTNTDWVDQVLQRGQSLNANMSVSGGNDRTRFYVSGGFRDEESIFVGNDYRRISTRMNIDHNVFDNIRIGANLMYTNIDDKTVPINWAGGVGNVISNLPIWPVYKEDGTFFNPTTNALASVELRDINFKSNTFLGSWHLNASIVEGLVFRSEYGLNLLSNHDRQYSDALLSTEGRARASSTIGTRTSWNFKNLLNYTKNLGKHYIDILGGVEMQKFNRNVNNLIGDGFFNSTLRTPQDAANLRSSFGDVEYAFLSYLGRLNYNYDDKYLLSVTARRDGSSRFGKNRRWGFFPAASVGYILSEEPFFEPIKRTVNLLKFRASYGRSGNAEIGNFAYLSTYSQSNYDNNSGVVLGNIGDDKLGWETTDQLNLGVSMELFNGRIRGEFDYYDKQTSDLLLPFPVSRLTGVNTVQTNLGEMSNKGFEISLTTTNISTKDILWETEFTVARNENKVVSLGPNVSGGIQIPGFGTTSIFEGHPIGITFVPQWAGVDPATGDDKYLDLEGNELLMRQILAQFGSFGNFATANSVVYGEPWPKFTGGFDSRFAYKNWYFDVFFTFAQGANFNSGELLSSKYAFSSSTINPHRHLLNRWRNPGDVTDVSRVDKAPTIFTRTTEYFYDVDFIRMKDLTVGYSFTPDKLFFESIGIYAKLTNFFTWTNAHNSIWDPEFVGGNSGNLNQTGFWRTSPQAKSVTVGLNVKF